MSATSDISISSSPSLRAEKKSPFGQPNTMRESDALRLQLGEEHELALVGFAAVEDVLVEERADGGVGGARLRGDLLDLLLHRR